MSARQRLTFAAIAVVIAVVAVVVIATSGGSDDGSPASSGADQQANTTPDATPEPTGTAEAEATKPPEPEIPTVTVKNGEPVGGIKKIEVKEGDQVRFKVVSDVADEIHVHGYDFMKDVPAGGQVTFAFKADITGIFEAELEDRGVQIISLRVDPE